MSSVITAARPGSSDEDFLTTQGTPLAGTEIRVIDLEDGCVLPAGAVGEITVRGVGLMIGYQRDTEVPGQGLQADGWFRTGDLGRLDERGYLTVTGRLKDLIIRGGENISPAEVENRILEHRAVIQVTVIGTPDERLGERVAAVVRLGEPATPELLAELTAYCREALTAYKVPSRWYTVTSFPMTASRKTQRFRLRDSVIERRVTPWE